MPEENKLLFVDEDGVLQIDANALDDAIAEREKRKAEWDEFDEQSKSLILDALSKTGMVSAKTSRYSVNGVYPADIIQFDEEGFLANTPEEVSVEFVDINEQEEFDFERFKAEHPELAAKYTTKTMVPVVNLKKLEKKMPALFEKYVTRTKSDKKPYIRVKASN